MRMNAEKIARKITAQTSFTYRISTHPVVGGIKETGLYSEQMHKLQDAVTQLGKSTCSNSTNLSSIDIYFSYI